MRAIEDCIGIASSAGRAPVIPKRCQDRAALLEACLESKQTIAEARTGACSGPQPVRAAHAGEGEGGGGGGGEAGAAPAKRGRGRPRKQPAGGGEQPAGGGEQAPQA